MKWRRFIGAGSVVGLMAFTVAPFISCSFARGAQDPAPQAGKRQVCSLSDTQQQAAPKAFDELAEMVKSEPRCNNCHGAIDPYAENTDHAGGPMETIFVKGVKGKVDGDATRIQQCLECHNNPWQAPAPYDWFTNKNSLQLCKKMKADFKPYSSAFLGHIRNDQFSVIAFQGTRGLNKQGQSMASPYKIELPKFTADELTSKAQAWVDAMGGKFRGDEECGCVPHHYSLSMDMKSNQDSTSGGVGSHLEMSSHADIPLKFKDDGTFETDAQMVVTQTGYEHGRISIHTGNREDCTINGSLTIKFKLKGVVDEADEKHPILRLVSSNGSMGESGTATCSDGTTTTNPLRTTAAPGSAWDMPATVGEDYVIQMPGQNPPQFTSSMKYRINQTD